MNLINVFKKLLQPVVDVAVAAEKPEAEALVVSVGTKVEASVRAAVAKHADEATTDLIMAEVDVEIAGVEAEIDADIEAFRVKL